VALSAPGDGHELVAGDPVLRVERVQLGIGMVDGVDDVEQHAGAAGDGQQFEVVGPKVEEDEELIGLLAV
jgi:hypothetical protein